MKRLTLKAKRDFSIRRRHPWIFSGAVADIDGEAAVGETVAVCDAQGRTLGYGSYSPASQIRVRMLSFDPKAVPDAAYVEGLVVRAVARRRDFLASGRTNAVRLVNAESDGLPGVVADSYDGWTVCQFTSAGAEFWKGVVAAALMKSVPGCKGVAERTDVDVRAKEGLPTGESLGVLAGAEPPELVEIFEDAIRYYVDVRRGHKTGFYLDQREARKAVGALAQGRDVLNCFSYTGGFGLAAAAGGAAHVTQVDISHDALELAKRNAGLTFAERSTPSHGATAGAPSPHVSAPSLDYVEADVFKFLRTCRDEGRTFDLVVLDPPKFAESKAQVMKAARGYKDINLLAMKLLRPGGTLATFSCSGAMTQDLFDKVLAEAAQDAGRDLQVIARTRQGSDHPVLLNFPEGLYLKGVILRSLT